MHQENQRSNDKISIVIPVYRSEESLAILTERLHLVLKSISAEYEIIFIDDCSPDNSWEILKVLKENHRKTVKIARLLVNSGQHNAILCGLQLSTGNIVITMDDDLQNPPEEIPKLIEPIYRGYDLVIAAYASKKHSSFRNNSGQLIDWILRKIFSLPKDFQLTSFRATNRFVVDNVCQMGGVFPYITAMMFSSSARHINVLVEHHPRTFGSSNYNLKRSLSLAANLIFSYSPFPLYTIILFCFLSFLCSMVFSLLIIFRTLVYGTSYPGWASTVIIVSFFNGIIMLCLVIFGIYLSRISQQMTRIRVPYTISELHE
jgi:glycosyltransferase involved in cell wall biosynthesis